MARPLARTCAFVLLTLPLAGPALAQGAEFTVGDEVVFSGGPGAPTRSIQTGFSIKVDPRGTVNVFQRTATERGVKQIEFRGVPLPAAAEGDSGTGRPARLPGRHPSVDLSALDTDGLLATLIDADPARRAAAAAVLGWTRDPARRHDVAMTLEQALIDPDERVGARAAESLGRLGDRSVVPSLMNLVFNGSDRLALTSIEALSSLGDPSVAPELARLGRRDDGPVGQAARAAAARLVARNPAGTGGRGRPTEPGHTTGSSGVRGVPGTP